MTDETSPTPASEAAPAPTTTSAASPPSTPPVAAAPEPTSPASAYEVGDAFLIGERRHTVTGVRRLAETGVTSLSFDGGATWFDFT